jgi:hypothetical protein
LLYGDPEQRELLLSGLRLADGWISLNRTRSLAVFAVVNAARYDGEPYDRFWHI